MKMDFDYIYMDFIIVICFVCLCIFHNFIIYFIVIVNFHVNVDLFDYENVSENKVYLIISFLFLKVYFENSIFVYSVFNFHFHFI